MVRSGEAGARCNGAALESSLGLKNCDGDGVDVRADPDFDLGHGIVIWARYGIGRSLKTEGVGLREFLPSSIESFLSFETMREVNR